MAKGVMEMGEKTFLIVQHMDWEGPGQHLLAALLEARVDYRLVEAWRAPAGPGRFGG